MVFGFRQIVLMETYEASQRPAQIHLSLGFAIVAVIEFYITFLMR
jgi:hypothetical protein